MKAMKAHTLKLFDEMSVLIKSSERVSSPEDTDPEANFIFGGYSWISKKFIIWSIKYSKKYKRFVSGSAKCMKRVEYTGKLKFSSRPSRDGDHVAGDILFIGDQAEVAENILIERFNNKPTPNKIDYEPFEVVRDMLRNPRHPETIGGAPQIVKVYQYLNSAPLGVYWPDKKSARIHLQGRPCLGYERIDRWIIDPDTLRSEQISGKEVAIDLDAAEYSPTITPI
jgi:hypothetical protein